MRALQFEEMVLVSAGETLLKMARDACKGLPSSSSVTVTQTANGSIGYDATNTGMSTVKSATVNCGDMPRSTAPSSSGGRGNSGGSGARPTVGPFYRREN